MKIKRILSLVLAIALMAVVFVGCDKGTDTEGSDNTATVEVEKNAKLKVWGPAASLDLLKRQAKAFEDEHKDKNVKIISGLKRISKPGLRVYANKEDLPKVLGGLGIAIISTNKGVVTDKEARKLNVGGEVLAFVW